jgi:hypothetical protein
MAAETDTAQAAEGTAEEVACLMGGWGGRCK